MERLSEIQARIKNLGELGEVVGAMRSLAAVRVQQARAALPGIRKYTDVVDGALAQALALASHAAGKTHVSDSTGAQPTSGGCVAIAFTSEQGFVGAFNERVLDRATKELSDAEDAHDRLMVVGARGATLAAERHRALAWTTAMTTHGDGVVQVARIVAGEVYACARRGALRRVVLVYARTAGGAASEVVVTTILPFDPKPYLSSDRAADPPPLVNLAPADLIDRLVDELLFAELARAAMESFASENGARLATMEAAHASIDKKLTALSKDERRRRQDEITTELLDIVTGAEAVAGAR